jgi:hypothetical protein
MPAISTFFGISIRMYFQDTNQHRAPHLHAAFGEEEVVLRIPDGFVLAGHLPSNKLKLVQAWIEIRQAPLMEAWERAVRGEHPGKIPPLQ